MKKVIVFLIIFTLLSGCTTKKHDTYSVKDLSYSVPSSWEYKSESDVNYHYLSDGSMFFVSSENVGVSGNDDADQIYDDLRSVYDGFISSAEHFKSVSENYDVINKKLEASYYADYGNGKQYVNFYTIIKEANVYCLAFAGKSDSEKEQTKIFNDIISTIELD